MAAPAGDMRAIVFDGPGRALREVRMAIPQPGPGEVLLRVHACGVCRTDLHLLDGDVEVARTPRVLGHQILGTPVARGPSQAADDLDAPPGRPGPRRVASEAGRAGGSGAASPLLGVPWLGWTCGVCAYCTSGRENLCPRARFTGRDIDGGMAEYAVADTRYCFPVEPQAEEARSAPLLCAGLIGYRALRMCGEAATLGLYGFGAAAHIVAQVARWQGRRVFAFTREDDDPARSLALELGAEWAGSSSEPPPVPLQAAIVFAPVGALVPLALAAVEPGATVVCAGIHMSDIPSFPYSALWQERTLRSVANLTRADARELLALAPRIGLHVHVTTYPLAQAARALEDLRRGRFTGAAVLVP